MFLSTCVFYVELKLFNVVPGEYEQDWHETQDYYSQFQEAHFSTSPGKLPFIPRAYNNLAEKTPPVRSELLGNFRDGFDDGRD